MSLDDYKVVLYRNQPDGWVAEIPAIPGCYALMPTREQALAELERVFDLLAAEGLPLPADSTAIVNAWRTGPRAAQTARPVVRVVKKEPRAADFRRVAKCLGFERNRQTGSHERWIHPDGRAVTIPLHGGGEIGPPLLNPEGHAGTSARAVDRSRAR